MINLTKEQVLELLRTQRELDDRITTKNISDSVAAYFIEFFEWANTVEFFKNWKKKAGKPKELQLEELADILAFGLSLTNQVADELEVSSELVADGVIHAINENGDATFKFTSANFIAYVHTLIGETMKGISLHLVVTMVYIPFLIANTYYTQEELLDAYKKKMEKNHERQNNNY